MTTRDWKWLQRVEGLREWASKRPHLDFSRLAYMTDNQIIEIMKAANPKNNDEAGEAVWNHLHPKVPDPKEAA